jgi:putative DNA primase/helicase
MNLLGQPLHYTRSVAADVAHALADRTEDIAVALLGNPSSRTKRELRWGSRGSMCCAIAGQDRGRWFNHEHGEGGDMLHLVAHVYGVDIAEAMRIAQDRFVGSVSVTHKPLAPQPTLLSAPKATGPDPDKEAKAAAAQRIWADAVALPGTLGEFYIRQVRGIDFDRLPPLVHALRWHAGIRAVVGRFFDPGTGEALRGVARIFLNADGTNVVDIDDKGRRKNRKLSLGYTGVVCLSPSDEVTMGLGLTEGIEDGLAVLAAGWAPVWCTIGTSTMRNLPVLGGIEELTIFADADEGGMAAANACANRWRASGCAATIVSPEVLA